MTNYNANFLDRPTLERLPFRGLGSNVLIDASVKIIEVENLALGDNVRIDANTTIVCSGRVEIGSWVHIAGNCYLEGRGGLTIEDFCNVSSFVSLHSVSDDFSGRSLTNPMTPDRFKNLDERAVILRRHAAIGAKSTILPGVTLEQGAVVGAHSLVRSDCEAWTIYAGVPAIPRGNRDRLVLDLEAEMLRDLGK